MNSGHSISIKSKRAVFLFGFRKTLPFQSGVIPFGLLYATIASAAGFPWWMTLLMSAVVYGGSSQLVFIDLFQQLGSALQAVLGANIVNARHLIYSAGVSAEFSHFSRRWRMLLSYFLTDQLYALSESHKKEISAMPTDLAPWFYLGAGFCTWFFWLASSAFGIAFEHFIPASWNLGFSIPLMFMPLVFGSAKTRWAYLTCLFAAGLVWLLRELPYGLGVFGAILLASLAGFLFQRWATGGGAVKQSRGAGAPK